MSLWFLLAVLIIGMNGARPVPVAMKTLRFGPGFKVNDPATLPTKLTLSPTLLASKKFEPSPPTLVSIRTVMMSSWLPAIEYERKMRGPSCITINWPG